MKELLIEGHIYKDGDFIYTVIPQKYHDEDTDETIEEDEEIEGVIHISDELIDDKTFVVYICQNYHDGRDCPIDKRKGYKYSWVCHISDNGEILTADTQSIRPRNVLTLAEKAFNDDEDIMPEDWVCDEIIPKDL